MAEGLIPKVENLQLEDLEILTEDQIKQELGIPQSLSTVLDYLKRSFLENGINLDQFGPAQLVSLRDLSIQRLRISVLILTSTLNDLVMHSIHFRQHHVGPEFGAHINYPYAMTMEEFIAKWLHTARLNHSGILRIWSKTKDDLVKAIINMTNLVMLMRNSRVPFHIWPIPPQLI